MEKMNLFQETELFKLKGDILDLKIQEKILQCERLKKEIEMEMKKIKEK